MSFDTEVIDVIRNADANDIDLDQKLSEVDFPDGWDDAVRDLAKTAMQEVELLPILMEELACGSDSVCRNLHTLADLLADKIYDRIQNRVKLWCERSQQ